jgi:hypothetical protein
MNITIDRNGTKYGPYTLEEIKEYLSNGNVNETDWAWHDDCTDWVPISSIVESIPQSPTITLW